MNSKQIIAIAVALVLVLGIYKLTSNVNPKKKVEADAHAGHNHAPGEGHDHDHEHETAKGPMMGGGAMMVQAANLDSLKLDVKKRLMSPQVNAEINDLEHKASTATDNASKFKALESLGKRWQAAGQKGIAGFSFAAAGNLENSEKILNFAAHLFEEGMKSTDQASIRQLFANERVATLNKVSEINPKNDTVVMDIAMAMIEQGDVMNGVLKLRDFADKNPKNLKAQITLGKMALQSNQVDKAIERGEGILKLDKENFEAHLILGEAYKAKGEIKKAIEYFNKAKLIIKNPNFDRDMDNYIAEFKK